jgi:MoaA/NifB/PqqE/SkfB family radical SAM enzyme
MECPYCITEDGVQGLTFPDAVAALEAMRADGVDNIVLGGGEPLLWRHDAFLLAARAKQMGFYVQLGTNGIRLPPGFENRPEVDRYVLPLDSMDPAVHDYLRPWRESHHAMILARLERLRAVRKSTTISTVVTRRNAAGLEEVGDYLRGIDPAGEWIHAWHLYRFLPHGRGGEMNAADLAVTPGEYEEAVRGPRSAGLPFPVYRRFDMKKAKSVEFHWAEGGSLRKLYRGNLSRR